MDNVLLAQNTPPQTLPTEVPSMQHHGPAPYVPGPNTNNIGEAHAWMNDIVRFVETPNGIAILFFLCLLFFGLWKAYFSHKAEMAIKTAAFKKQKNIDEAGETLLTRLEKQVDSLQSKLDTAIAQRNADWENFWKVRKEDQAQCDDSIAQEIKKRQELFNLNTDLEKQNREQALQIAELQSDLAGLSTNVGTLFEELSKRRSAEESKKTTS